MAPGKLPTYFISHGGGPWPWMKREQPGLFDELERSLVDIAREVGTLPKAVLVISGHWEEREVTIQTGAHPPMVYDYYGFPPHTYQVRYPAPGSPELAREVGRLLVDAGIPVREDAERGYDHGTFTPLAVMYPHADVPVVQLSMKTGYDPAAHLAVGRAIAPLREEGVLIVGSGLSYHNLRQMGPGAREVSKRFDDWLQATLQLAPAARTQALLRWSEAPAARQAHPQEDHLVPLFVAVGAAEQEPATCVYHEAAFYGNVTASSFRLGAA